MRGSFMSKLAVLLIALFLGSTPVCAESQSLANQQLSSQEKEQFKARFKEDAASILKVVDRWAKSWSDLNIDDYLSCYEAQFHPDSYPSAGAWQYSRHERFSKQKWVKLQLTGMVLSLKGAGMYSVEFTQSYKSDTFSDTTRKELLFRKTNGQWKIAAENTLKK